MNRSTIQPLLLLALLTIVGCSSGTKGGGKYPEFVANGVSASYDRDELKENFVYPEEAKKGGQTIVLSVSLSKEGEVTEAKVIKSDNEDLNDAALEAVKKTRFTPATQNGHPIPFRLHIKIEV